MMMTTIRIFNSEDYHEEYVELIRGTAIKQNDSTLEKQANLFGHLYTLEWPAKNSSIVNKTLDQNKFEKGKFASNNG